MPENPKMSLVCTYVCLQKILSLTFMHGPVTCSPGGGGVLPSKKLSGMCQLDGVAFS